jgi:hypothetical protein
MQSRFAIVVMSIAGAGLLFCAGLVFGLGVMSTPKGGQHKEIAVTNTPVKVARRETTGSSAPDALTPLTPVHPGTSSAQPTTQASAPQPAAPVQAAPGASAAPRAAPQTQKTADSPAQEAKAAPAPQAAPAEPAPVKQLAPANATPVSLHAKNSCDVQACSRAYKSFRAEDCTYQPYSGPRQLCVNPPAPAKEASRGDDKNASVRVRRGDRDVEIRNVPRDRVVDGASIRDDDGPALRRQVRRDFTADGEDDGIDDSRVIVRSDDDRGDGWQRSFLAPVEDDDQ